MNKKLTTKEAVIVLVIFGLLAVFGIIRFGITQERYKIYIGNVVVNKVENALLKYYKKNGTYLLLQDTLITDYNAFRELFPLKLLVADFQQFIYKVGEKEYYISIIANDRKRTEIKRVSK
ncbi:MAG: hypothetical protein Q7J55_00200 [bacterium]|nr:hypothetical protein [bacterium]